MQSGWLWKAGGCRGSDRASSAMLAQNMWLIWAGGREQGEWMLLARAAVEVMTELAAQCMSKMCGWCRQEAVEIYLGDTMVKKRKLWCPVAPVYRSILSWWDLTLWMLHRSAPWFGICHCVDRMASLCSGRAFPFFRWWV